MSEASFEIKKICHIGPALYVQGGISSVLLSYKKLFNLSDKNFMASYNGSFVKSLPQLFFVCLKLLLCSNKDFLCYQIHTSSYGSFFRKYLISLCIRLRNKKYTVHIHGSLFQKFCSNSSFFIRLLIKNYIRHSAAVICITPDMQIFMEKYLGTDHPSFFVVPNPCEHISEHPKKFSRNSLVKIVFAGRFGKRKGVYDLLEAFSKSNFSMPVELSLFGDGEVCTVEKACQKSSKKDFIKFSGWLSHSEYLKILPEFDFLVLPSYAETFGMSLVEAMGCGLPVISTYSGGVPFVVENEISGILIDAGDVISLKNALERLVDNEELRSRMGNAAWENVRKRFTSSVVLGQLNMLYSELFKIAR